MSVRPDSTPTSMIAAPARSEIEAALDLLVDVCEHARVGDRVAADVEDPHHDRLARAQLERPLAELERINTSSP